MTQAALWMLITILVYLGGMLVVGFLCAKGNDSAEDFFLGGRKLGPIITAMSAEANDMSSYLLMGLPGLALLSGIADVGWTAIGLAVGTYLNWLFVARRIRRYSQLTGAFTLPQFFSRRFRDEKKILSVIAASIIIIFFVPYTASGFAACGKLFSALFGMEYMTAMLISAVVIVAYTVAGGFLAAAMTDFVQSIIMTVAIVAILVFGITSAGGWGAVVENAKSLPGYFEMFATYSGGEAQPYGFLKIVSTLAWGLGYFGMPHILLQFMAVKDEKKLKISRRVGSVWVVIAMGMAILIGITGNAMGAKGLIPALTGTDTEMVIIRISEYLADFGILPAVIAGLALSGILASTMSTSDSQLLAASSSITQDVLEDKLGLKLSQKTTMLVARLTVLAVAVLGVILAQNPGSSIFGIVSFAWAGFGAGFGPVVLCALFWKRTTLPGAISGMIAGGATVFLWKYLVAPLGSVFAIYELLPAFLVGLLVIVVVSLLTKKPSEEILAEFESTRSGI